MHGRDGACFHQSTHGQCALQTQRDIRAIQREIRFDVPRQKQRGSGNGATAPTSHTDTRSRAEVHLRALELVGIRIPRGGSGGSRDREQDQRRRADPRGPPPAPIPCTAHEQPGLLGPDLCFGSGGDAVSAPNAASGNGRRGRRRLGTGRRGAARDLGLGFWRAGGFRSCFGARE